MYVCIYIYIYMYIYILVYVSVYTYMTTLCVCMAGLGGASKHQLPALLEPEEEAAAKVINSYSIFLPYK